MTFQDRRVNRSLGAGEDCKQLRLGSAGKPSLAQDLLSCTLRNAEVRSGGNDERVGLVRKKCQE